jgi:hypothetical protein
MRIDLFPKRTFEAKPGLTESFASESESIDNAGNSFQ